ncbi:MAG: restriction endonuclease subunit S [Bacteroidaceae bacterium]|nr:restriction endonuclease subunit S [Bacteroidaceae bacterium]
MEEWKESIIEQTSIQMIDGDRGKNYPKNSDFFSQGYCLFLNAGNVTKSGFSFSDNAFITEDKDQLLRKGRLERNDVVITTRGTVGNVALYDSSVPYEHVRINSGMLILKGGRDILPEYLYYFLKGSRFQNQIAQFVSGSAQPQLPKSTLGKMKISFPIELNVQKRICGVLKSLDDKIEVNRRINDNLEQQAQALFKSWFVDFEPFRDGEFVESELGMIPKGWRVGTLGEMCKCILGGTPSRDNPNFWGGKIAWINSGEVNRFRITTPSEFITEEGLNRSATKLLPKKTTVLAITGATLGQVSLLEIDSCANQSVIGVLENEDYPYSFIYPLIKEKIGELMSHMTGGAQQHINKNNVEGSDVVIPSPSIVSSFNDIAYPLYEKIGYLCLENDRLSQLRDTLLPRLMSGEIKVGDVTL